MADQLSALASLVFAAVIGALLTEWLGWKIVAAMAVSTIIIFLIMG